MKKIRLSNHGHYLYQASMGKLHKVVYFEPFSKSMDKISIDDYVLVAVHGKEHVLAQTFKVSTSSKHLPKWTAAYQMAIGVDGKLFEVLYITHKYSEINEYCLNNIDSGFIDEDNHGRYYIATTKPVGELTFTD